MGIRMKECKVDIEFQAVTWVHLIVACVIISGLLTINAYLPPLDAKRQTVGFIWSTLQECVCWGSSSCPQFTLHINELAVVCASSKQITLFTVNFTVCQRKLM